MPLFSSFGPPPLLFYTRTTGWLLKHIFLCPGPATSVSCPHLADPLWCFFGLLQLQIPAFNTLHCSLLTFLILSTIYFSLCSDSQWPYIGEIRNRISPPVSGCFIYCASFSPNSACWIAPAFSCHKCLYAFSYNDASSTLCIVLLNFPPNHSQNPLLLG